MEILYLHQPVSDDSFAEVVGLSQPAALEMRRILGLDETATASEFLLAYCRRIRAQASGHTGELAQERARLAREQADAKAMENAVRRRELAPIGMLEEALARMARQVAGILEAIPVVLRRQGQAITPQDRALIEREIVRARNLAAAVQLEWEDGGPVGTESSDPVGAETA